jgi:hypothetical protein
MRKTEFNVYTFDELNDDAKMNAIEKMRDTCSAHYEDDIADYYCSTIKKFGEMLGIEIDVRSHYSSVYFHADWRGRYFFEDLGAEYLSGKLLQRYIRNEVFGYLVSHKKYYSKDYKKYRISSIMINKDYLESGLTGYFSDNAVIQPFVDYMKHPDNGTTLADIVERSLSALLEEYETDKEYGRSDESVKEELSVNNYEFYENGTWYR